MKLDFGLHLGSSPVVASGLEVIGGVTVGSGGEAGTIYEGYTLSWGDDFTGLSVVGPSNPRGRWFPTRNFAIQGANGLPQRGARGSLTDPNYTGWLDSNRGIAVGFNNIRVANSVLTVQARKATVAEQAHLISNVMIDAELFSTGACVACPDTGAAIIYEARVRVLPTGTDKPAGVGWGFWTQSMTPTTSPLTAADEIDIIEGYKTHTTYNYHPWASGVSQSNNEADYATADIDDGEFHVVACKVNKAQALFYIDGALKATINVDLNAQTKLCHFMLQTFALVGSSQGGSAYSQAEWDALGTGDNGGVRAEYDWARVWRPSGTVHYKPLSTIADLNVAYQGTGTIVLPSKLALWGDAGVTEYVQIVPTESNEPGVTASASYQQFPSGVTYDSGTRTITVDWSATTGSAGRCHGIVTATKSGGRTCEPARFTINRGPTISTTNISTDVDVPYSKDLYTECDVGIITPKVITVTGLPTGLSFSGSTISGTPTAVDDSTVTIGCTNSAGQSVSKQITLSVGEAGGDVISAWQSQNSVQPQGAGSTTFTALAIGTASASRYVLAGIINRAGIATEVVTAVTIGGVSASQVAVGSNTASGLSEFSFWIAAVPTGTTADVVITNGAVGDAGRIGVGLWSVLNLESTTATDTASDFVVATTTFETTIDVTAGGFIAAIEYINQGSNTRTWTGLTERYDGALAGGVSWSNASDDFAGALTGRTISTVRQAGAGTINNTAGLFVVAMR